MIGKICCVNEIWSLYQIVIKSNILYLIDTILHVVRPFSYAIMISC